MKKRRLCFIFGTRPEIIKVSPLIKLCQKRKIPFFCIHTGQHYSYKLDQIFVKELGLPKPKYNLRIRSSAPERQGEHTGRMMIKIEDILLKEMPYCVLVHGDTNSTLAGLLTAEKITSTKSFTGLEIKIAHVEAGLRSFDRKMPEEINRIIVDHFSNYLFVPTKVQKQYLLNEGVPRANIYITGNTITDVVKEVKPTLVEKSVLAQEIGVERSFYILLTLHRQENVNSPVILRNIFKGLSKVRKKLDLPIVFPIHPRTQNIIDQFKIKIPKSVRVIPPVGYHDFLWLEANAALILTDSGGVQEEACALHVPCVTLRENTERPETVTVGANIIAGTDPDKIMKAAFKMLKSKRKWKNPLGQGNTSKKILDVLMK